MISSLKQKKSSRLDNFNPPYEFGEKTHFGGSNDIFPKKKLIFEGNQVFLTLCLGLWPKTKKLALSSCSKHSIEPKFSLLR